VDLSEIEEASELEYEQTPEPHQRASPSLTNEPPSSYRKRDNFKELIRPQKKFRIKHRKSKKKAIASLTSTLSGENFKQSLQRPEKQETRTITNFHKKTPNYFSQSSLKPGSTRKLNVYLDMRTKLKRRLMVSYLKNPKRG
jgi:hypothetical protein